MRDVAKSREAYHKVREMETAIDRRIGGGKERNHLAFGRLEYMMMMMVESNGPVNPGRAF